MRDPNSYLWIEFGGGTAPVLDVGTFALGVAITPTSRLRTPLYTYVGQTVGGAVKTFGGWAGTILGPIRLSPEQLVRVRPEVLHHADARIKVHDHAVVRGNVDFEMWLYEDGNRVALVDRIRTVSHGTVSPLELDVTLYDGQVARRIMAPGGITMPHVNVGANRRFRQGLERHRQLMLGR